MAPLSRTGDDPYLTETDAASIGMIIQKYDQYVNEVHSRRRQITGDHETEIGFPVNIKFRFDVDSVGLSIDPRFTKDALSYDTINDEQLRAILEKREKESKEIVTLDKLDKLVANELGTNLKKAKATARVQDLFAQ